MCCSCRKKDQPDPNCGSGGDPGGLLCPPPVPIYMNTQPAPAVDCELQACISNVPPPYGRRRSLQQAGGAGPPPVDYLGSLQKALGPYLNPGGIRIAEVFQVGAHFMISEDRSQLS